MTDLEFLRSFPLEIVHRDRWVRIETCDEHADHVMFGCSLGDGSDDWANAASIEQSLVAVLVFAVQIPAGEDGARWHFVRKALEWRDLYREAVPAPSAGSASVH